MIVSAFIAIIGAIFFTAAGAYLNNKNKDNSRNSTPNWITSSICLFVGAFCIFGNIYSDHEAAEKSVARIRNEFADIDILHPSSEMPTTVTGYLYTVIWDNNNDKFYSIPYDARFYRGNIDGPKEYLGQRVTVTRSASKIYGNYPLYLNPTE